MGMLECVIFVCLGVCTYVCVGGGGGVKLVEFRLSNSRETLSEAAVVNGNGKRFRFRVGAQQFRDSFKVPPTVRLLTFDLIGL